MTRNLAVEIKSLNKSYHTAAGDVPALRNIDLSVPAGELFMLVGPSGCGKTTLISVIAGILNFDSGACRVLEADYGTMRPAEIVDFRAKNIGFVFQSFNLLPALTAAENVAVPLIIAGVARAEALARATALLADVNLGQKANALPAELSGGQQQRVAIARALIHKPGLIVCDEPTSALDHETGERVMQLMRTIKTKYNTTLIIVTHDSRIFNFADRVAHMDDGRVVKVERGSNQAGAEYA